MIVKATATFTGRDALGRFVETKITPGIIAGIEQFDQLVKKEARAIAPVRSGEFRDSIDVIPVDNTGKTVRGGVQATAAHSGFVEYGTGVRGAASPGAGPYPYDENWPGMAAQPTLRPAVDIAREPGRVAIINEISTRIR